MDDCVPGSYTRADHSHTGWGNSKISSTNHLVVYWYWFFRHWQQINDLTPGQAVSNCLLNKIREHEHPVHFFFRINKRLQIFSQAPEIQLGGPQKQSVTQLFFISDGHFSIQIIKIHPGFSQQENNVEKVAAHRPATAENTKNFLCGQDVGGHDVNSWKHVEFVKDKFIRVISDSLLIQIDTEPQEVQYNPDKFILNKFDVFSRISIVPADILAAQKILCIFSRSRPIDRKSVV